MSIEKIDHELCNGCGICVNSGPMDVIRMDEEAEKAIIRYPEDCMMRDEIYWSFLIFIGSRGLHEILTY